MGGERVHFGGKGNFVGVGVGALVDLFASGARTVVSRGEQKEPRFVVAGLSPMPSVLWRTGRFFGFFGCDSGWTDATQSLFAVPVFFFFFYKRGDPSWRNRCKRQSDSRRLFRTRRDESFGVVARRTAVGR